MSVDYIALVAEFHDAFDISNASPETPEEFAERKVLRDRLTNEEMTEIEDAALARDIVGVFDGICDLLYIASGNVLSLGFGSLLTTQWSSGCPRVNLNRDEDFNLLSDIVATLRANVNEFLHGELPEQANAWLIEDLIDGATELGLPLEAGFLEVHASNMMKLGPDGRPLKNEFGKVIKPEGWKAPDLERVLG